MKLIAKIKLVCTNEQKQSLLETLKQCNVACNYISKFAFENKVFQKYDIHKKLYYIIRKEFNLSAQMTVRCIAKVADSYKLDKKQQRIFYRYGAIAYDSRILTYFFSKEIVSILTLNGRIKISFITGEHQKQLLQFQQGESQLIYYKNNFYLHAVCNIQEDDPIKYNKFIGVDLGIINIATSSDGEQFSGEQVEKVRQKYSNLRATLQKKGTRSAKRKLKKISKNESNFRRNTNHIISKTLINKAKTLGKGIAIEDLKKIKQTVRKAQRNKHSSWSFYQLRQFIEYKAKLFGIKIIAVNPRNTSRQCSKCGFISKKNRKSQSNFLCVKCGFSLNADHQAAINIAAMAFSTSLL